MIACQTRDTIIQFSFEKRLDVQIFTTNLKVVPITPTDVGNCCLLYSDWTTHRISAMTEKIERWDKKWSRKNPWSVFAVRLLGNNAFLGYIGFKRVSPRDKSALPAPLAVELFGHGYSEFWQDYGVEATAAVIKTYVQAVHQKFKLHPTLVLDKITAIATRDNKISNKALAQAGMKMTKIHEFNTYYSFEVQKVLEEEEKSPTKSTGD